MKMVVVDGVRYRADDVPSKKKVEAPEVPESKEAKVPANKARAAASK